MVNPEFDYLERSHMRIVINEIGRPLTEFKSTRELVTALRDAVIGHQQAWLRAGILHRDVSVGNILIVDEPGEEAPSICGFLHDFDYSSMTPLTPLTDKTSGAACAAGEPSSAKGPKNSEAIEGDPTDNNGRKERTGTYYFMAYGLLLTDLKRGVIHEAHHDLESIYWILIWVVLRHTDCSAGKRTPSQLSKGLFVYGDDMASYRAKRSFVEEVAMGSLTVHGNEPLTDLISAFSDLVNQQHSATVAFMKGKKASGDGSVQLTYEAVLELLDGALETLRSSEAATGGGRRQPAKETNPPSFAAAALRFRQRVLPMRSSIDRNLSHNNSS
ncbi:hypothetical protein NUW54_g6644 [Trametes sanguinea]|uniref:Uncharacterized protein n=1 Tax=Trametes sanguinea TaxID=158606 RepID=A0ACC1PTH3_9APHY|nr:hypothetical protein NUW54_g6644 [Trametes sanguinea]